MLCLGSHVRGRARGNRHGCSLSRSRAVTGAPAASSRFGTAADDSVDIFGESQLAGAIQGIHIIVTGVTYGSTTATLSHGGADVFVTSVPAP
ncbi:hypothetical protein [Lapillicoccus sp.]|uniref:hypothetical protein n=1 Tax=Lapillicoccus sp. TaxID=1909287 RepID=UPI0025DBC8C9|nr:hypothetical protein [Lapillicoccus sp.]